MSLQARLLRLRAEVAFLGLERAQPRDRKGRFASGGSGGATPGTGGHGVRDVLSGHDSAEGVSAAAAKEAKRITGRDIEFSLAGDPQIAAEHSEGILRGLERYPKTPLSRVVQGGSTHAEGEEAWGETSRDGSTIRFTDDAQRYGAASYRADLRSAGQLGELTAGTPTGVALHEFGHAAANSYNLNGWANNRGSQYAEIDMGTTDLRAASRTAISSRAAVNDHELSAEAFTDVMVHGDRASGMSKLIVQKFDEEVRYADAPIED